MTDAMLSCPFLILAIALCGVSWTQPRQRHDRDRRHTTPIFVRLTRGQVMAVKVEDYVEAARAIGNPRWRIALFHILPNILPALLVQGTLSIAAADHRRSRALVPGPRQQRPRLMGLDANSAQRFLTNAPWMAICRDWRSS